MKKFLNCDIGGLDLSLCIYFIWVIRMGFCVVWWVVLCVDMNWDWVVVICYVVDDW